MRRALVRGGVSGILATGVMSVVFVVAQRAGLLDEKPPRLIVDRFLPALTERSANRVALVTHFAYGAAGGVVHEFSRRIVPASTPHGRALRGVVFGLLVWAVGYEGWVPVARVLPFAHRDDRGRAGSILAAHLVYGLSLEWASARTR
jgi:hypothetical protein